MSQVSDIGQQDSVSNTGSASTSTSKSSRAKVAALRIKAAFHDRRAQMEFSDLQLRQERERLELKEELAIADAEDEIFQEQERAASGPLRPFHPASSAILNESSATLRPPSADQHTVVNRAIPASAEEHSFNTDRDIINQMPFRYLRLHATLT